MTRDDTLPFAGVIKMETIKTEDGNDKIVWDYVAPTIDSSKLTRDDILRMADEAYNLAKQDLLNGDYLTTGFLAIRDIHFHRLATAAVKHEWIGLTDEEFSDCLVAGDPCENLAEPEAWEVMRQVEAKLKEKNSG